LNQAKNIDSLRMEIRRLSADDPAVMHFAFLQQGWDKPQSQFEHYLSEQSKGEKEGLLAWVDVHFAGYLLISWKSWYPPFEHAHIPEIVDLNVLKIFQRKRIASRLMDEAEKRIFAHHRRVGITVGLTSDYGAAQKLYVSRGYVPDGQGISQNEIFISKNQNVIANDDLVLALTKDRPEII
jgi:ribosomal protein S18 acetylase RimI-like enzyme